MRIELESRQAVDRMDGDTRRSARTIAASAVLFLLVSGSGAFAEDWGPRSKVGTAATPDSMLDPVPALVSSDAPFAVMDAQGDATGTTPVRDISYLAAYNDGTHLVLTLQFWGAISPPNTGNTNEVVGFIDLDLDRDPSTGEPSMALGDALGWEASVDLFSWSDASDSVQIVDATMATIATGRVQRFGNGLDVMIGLEALGLSPGSVVHVAAITGDPLTPTDDAPDSGIPLPSSDDVIYLGELNRFMVQTSFRDFTDRTDSGRLVDARSDDSALFWFFEPDNWEVMVKLLDGCPINGNFWVFAAATTNVEYELVVFDRFTSEERSYFNPLGNRAAAITDTAAFATCP